MSPRAVNFRAGNVIYMKGFRNSYVYVLKSGVVSLNYQDIQTGQEDQDQIRTGELFGVKSALGGYTTDEQALALVDSTVLAFTVEEFEQVASNNTRIIMKMLKVYSTQLRRIHRQVQNLLSTGDNRNAEEGLYNVGIYYHNNQKYRQSVAAFKRYLIHYPRGKFLNDVKQKIDYGKSMYSEAPSSTDDDVSSGSGDIFSFSEAMEYYESGEFRKALQLFSKIQESRSPDAEESAMRIGICLFRLGRGSDASIRLTDFIKKNGQSQYVPEALYYIGECYKSNRDTEKAVSFYKKALSMSDPSQQIYILITETLQKLEGEGK
ncbi:cyclic nucleotide-binding domain-containing protein [Spirochaeta isovalerica]|uniref:TolA-binding protein n=1 Tax=Spirochaeta isovalerica TaxID=150 RepID=A0A841R6N9_9SPIO|nr:TolA-binding protein [Spirochaeta isovalerica]